MAYKYAPDQQLQFANIGTYIVPTGQTVRVGAPVKLSALDNPDPLNHKGRVIQEAVAADDDSIGTVLGEITNPRESFAAGEIVRVAHYFHMMHPAFAKGNIVAGARVVPASGGGYVTAPALNNAGATLVFSPGIALDAAVDGQAFTFAPLPKTYMAT